MLGLSCKKNKDLSTLGVLTEFKKLTKQKIYRNFH